MDVQRYAEKLIADAIASGDLVPHEGLGEPLPTLDADPAWWVRALLQREQLPDRRAKAAEVIDGFLDAAVRARTLEEARVQLATANRLMRSWNLESPPRHRFEERSEIWLLDERAGRPAG